MKILCLSASNIEPAKNHSASTRTCELIRENILASHSIDAQVEILPMIDYELKPCRMCGRCFEGGTCVYDADFNSIFDELKNADRIFIVCPHYATIPAKLVILLEKFQEMAYLNYSNNTGNPFPLAQKKVGLIVHGGQTEEVLPIYRKTLLVPLASILGSIGMQVVGLDEENPHGLVFGITSLVKPDDSIFVKINHDWDAIRQRIEPLVENVLSVAE